MRQTFQVPRISCGHYAVAIDEEVREVSGVTAVDVDLNEKLVTVRGHDLAAPALRTAIEAAGYEVEG